MPPLPWVDTTVEAPLSQLVGADDIAPFLAYFGRDETLRWRISAPRDAAARAPQGLVVFVSANGSGTVPAMWRPLLVEKNLVWIGADDAGNDASTQRRVLQALLAARLAARAHDIDPRRIYLAGFSGGSRVASRMAPLYPQAFRGYVFMGGASAWGREPPRDLPLMRERGYVFVNGSDDFNLDEGRSVSRRFRGAGLDHVEFIEVPGLDHHLPDAAVLGWAIDYLDAHPPRE
ncbi:alpha/beta hydrolase [Pseudoxanthomonas sp. 10H]|uniref:hypothetical protein n=1 Tax=Pseudoxanthomonas sp. 10H TaxID=3242729 RepID=UPI0035584019